MTIHFAAPDHRRTTSSVPRHRVIESPLGRLTLVVNGARALAAVLVERQEHTGSVVVGERDDAVADDAASQLTAYFDGGLTRFHLMLAPQGTSFQQRVWAEIARVPYGVTQQYGQVATALGAPGSARAVGAATGRNPLSIVVPCHRLVGASGALTGYAGGLDRKRWLLDHERDVSSGRAVAALEAGLTPRSR